MGFAALESSGYVFTALLESRGSLTALVLVTLLRGLLVAGRARHLDGDPGQRHVPREQTYRFRLDRAVIGAYLTVVVLHGLWDGLP